VPAGKDRHTPPDANAMRPRQDRHVTPATHVRLILDLDLAADPIGGFVRDAHGDPEPFAGWMALTRTIELSLDAARQRHPAATGDPAARPPAAHPS
jgi:hypothetical protein